MTDADTTRWLHRHSELGYTRDPRQALPNEPAALNAHDLEALQTAAHRRQLDRQRTEVLDRQLLSFERRLMQARAQARHKRIDISSELGYLRLAFAQNRKPSVLTHRLERIEQRIFADPPT